MLERSEIASLKGNAPKTEKVFPVLGREMLIDCIKLIRDKKTEYEITEKIFPLPGVYKNTCTGCNICVLLCPSGCLTSREKDGHFKLLADPLRAWTANGVGSVPGTNFSYAKTLRYPTDTGRRRPNFINWSTEAY